MSSDKPRILLIDDELACLGVISKALTMFGYPNEKFSNPREAIEAFISGKFDIVITDYKMPEMNGVEILKAAKTHDPNVYVIILTGYADNYNATTALNIGAYAFFYKPLEINRLLGKISEIENELETSWQREETPAKLCLEFRGIEKTFKKST